MNTSAFVFLAQIYAKYKVGRYKRNIICSVLEIFFIVKTNTNTWVFRRKQKMYKKNVTFTLNIDTSCFQTRFG